jgi:ABC-2 type transport system permease protein
MRVIALHLARFSNMWYLFKKELGTFLHSLTGYLVMGIFLLVTSLFLWVFPGTFNLPDAGYASLDPMFILAPWMFVFLIPAITMRSFSEEFRTGTIELLLTKPITLWQVIGGKYLASVVLLLLCLIPTLFYFYALSVLGAPKNNVDTGAMWGSYAGLLLVGAAYAAIGIFASSVTSNQIIAFIAGVFLNFFMFVGFESISSLKLLGIADHIFIKLGMNEHYISLSRGVIDTRDVLYFASITAIFLIITKLSVELRKG